MNSTSICWGIVVVLLLLAVLKAIGFFKFPTIGRRHRLVGTEQAWVVKDKRTGREIEVSHDAMRRAAKTGDYDVLGKSQSPRADYTGTTPTGRFNGTIPHGHIFTDKTYDDERLNG